MQKVWSLGVFEEKKSSKHSLKAMRPSEAFSWACNVIWAIKRENNLSGPTQDVAKKKKVYKKSPKSVYFKYVPSDGGNILNQIIFRYCL